MTSDELRTAFLKFFEGNNHKVVPSSSLVPHGDPTLLLTSAGMVQFKPYLTGEAAPPSKRLASCQKCFRTTDIELVGDSTHHTFFEMLGNFSIGDYFKKEAIAWAFEFITKVMEVPPDRLWATVYLDDDDAFNYWRETGIPEQRLRRFDESDNFWGPVGDSGPCGPDTEIFYDFGEEAGCGKPHCAPNCDCDRFIEIGTLVFMQYEQHTDGNRTPLPAPSIDTGFGLERNIALVQGKNSVYETDLFSPMMERISGISGKKFGTNDETDTAMRAVADHSRAIAFLIADGVMPSNENRGYVLRRLLRRAVLFGRRLGLERAFLTQTAGAAIEQMGRVYPELVQRRDFILRVIELEEAGFSETLSTGLEMLGGILKEAGEKGLKQIPGREAFRLYDTYGFPPELAREIAAGNGLSVDMDGFEKEMEKQRQRARKAHRVERGDTENLAAKLDITETVFTGYGDLSQDSTVLGILLDSEPADIVEGGQQASLILSDTPFYGEMGGQVGDTGEILAPGARFEVTGTTRITSGVIMHQGIVTEGSFSVGDRVEARVDPERRRDIARNHTATHLLQAALRSVVGEHVQQRGSLVAADHFRFDFSHLVALTPEEIGRVQQTVNEYIRRNLPVNAVELPYQQAIDEGAIALFDEKYADTVRVLRVGDPPISQELCGGTHVDATGEIGFFYITGESSIGSGLRRIEAVTGRGAEAYITSRMSDLGRIAGYLDAERDEAAEKAQALARELKEERRRTQTLETQLARKEAASLGGGEKQTGGVYVNTIAVPGARMDALVTMSDSLRDDLINKHGDGIVVLHTVYEHQPMFVVNISPGLVARGYHAGEIVKRLAQQTGGNGGGRPNMAQGRGRDSSQVEEALRQVELYINEKQSSKGE